jgi:lysosomal-associated transmembrane protein
MPLNILGVDRRNDVWRTCFCFHVRTVTIFIGVWYLMVYILLLSLIAAVAMYEANTDGIGMSTTAPGSDLLPTPVSKTAEDMNFAEPLSKSTSESSRARMEGWKTGPLNILMDAKKANSQYALLTICNMLITLLMVYGAVRGKPSYLMPFFVLKVFDFCIFCLTMVGYFSYLPNVTEVIANQPNLPFRDDLLRLDPQLLSLLTLIIIVGMISMKAYVIGVIWNCYKFLMLRNTIIRGVISYRHDDPTNILGMQQNLLPDLPDYDTAINDPRYAKKPLDGSNNGNLTNNNLSNPTNSSGGMTMAIPPPPYSVAISTTNETMQTSAAQEVTVAEPSLPSSMPRDTNTEPAIVTSTNTNITTIDEVDKIESPVAVTPEGTSAQQ